MPPPGPERDRVLKRAIGTPDPVAEADPASAAGYVKGGKLRAIAVTDEKRTPVLPDIGTSTEQGFAGLRMQPWGGIYAPKGTPPAVLDRFAQAMRAVLEGDAALRGQLEAYGNQPMLGTRADFERFLRDEKVRLGQIVRDARMTVE